MKTITLAFLLLSVVVPAAQAQSLPRYGIEVLIFRNLDQSRNSPESRSPVLPEDFPDATTSNVFSDNAAQSATTGSGSDDEQDEAAISGRYIPMREQDLQLDGVYRRLLQLDAYQPLSQIAWIQPATRRASAEPYVIPLSVTDSSGLAGSVTVYKERYLHVALDLTLERRATAETSLASSPEPAILRESRRIRGKNFHYFDHPEFGAIVAVQRLEASPAASDEAPESPTGAGVDAEQ